MAKFLIPFVIFAVMVGFFINGLGRDTKLIPSPFIDKPAPHISVKQLDDPEKIFTNKDLVGKVSLVNFWASWCPTCEYEHPLFIHLAKETSIHLVGVNYKNSRADALGWLKRHGNPYNAIPVDDTGRVGIDWGVYGTPETFVVDKKGIVRYKHVGALNEDALINIVLPMVKKLEKEPAQ
ncbi:MAG: DsbE family thiol:disulfide interchange protein [Methylococcales bacterium]|jgi:cytochrome c biogenesis protein CcmG, thiol:disulfide interchange protein DsbE|nr:DsbE family thiol:disulfide interchange protein [Methylococcales bacterium]MBT7442847.1 DsbE family thiol:disulfide interchange protein [Methylococcales bacterium]